MTSESNNSRVAYNAFSIQKNLCLNSNPVIFDVGAFVGEVTGQYRQLFPSASIHSFEPFPLAFQELLRNTSRDSGIKVHNLAISDKCGSVILNSNVYAPTNSILNSDDDGKSYWGDGLLDTMDRFTVNSTKIDYFCEEQHIKMIDILKLDIQGAEYRALTGAEKMLSRQAISVLYTELILVPTYVGQRKFHEYLKLLDTFRYVLFGIFNPIVINSQLNQIDALFVSKKHLDSLDF